jgi:hypothetical protein
MWVDSDEDDGRRGLTWFKAAVLLTATAILLFLSWQIAPP